MIVHTYTCTFVHVHVYWRTRTVHRKAFIHGLVTIDDLMRGTMNFSKTIYPPSSSRVESLTTIVLINSSFDRLYTRYSTGLLEIIKSLFENSHSSSNFIDCILTDCIYQSNNIPNIHKVFNPNICWGSTIMVNNTFNDIKPFIYASHLLFNMFMND